MNTQVPKALAGQPPTTRQLVTQALAWLGDKLWWIAGGLIAIGLITYFAPAYVFGPVVPVATVTRQDIVQTVVASGTIQSPFRVAVGAQITGVVVNVPVAEGQSVKSGDVLIQIDDKDANEQVKFARGAVAQAQAKLSQLSGVVASGAAETLKQAQSTAADAQTAFDRLVKLRMQGFATQADYDTGRKALDIAKSQVSAAQILVDTSRPGGMDYLMAQTQLAQVEANLQSAQAHLTYTQIRAPRDGTLITRSVEKGDVVQPGKDLMDLAPAGETQVVMQIDEQNLGLLKLGQVAHLSADAYPHQKFDAQVSYINPSVNAASGSVIVKLTVPKPPDYLRQDMTVSAEIEVANHPQAVVIKTAAVRDLTSAKPWVMAVISGRAKRVEVTPGAIGDSAVEIVNGLIPGDLAITGTLTVSDGQRLRAANNG